MIAVDISQIEELTNLLLKAASDADETLSRLRAASAEIQNDVLLPQYAQTDVLSEAVSLATQTLNRGTDTLLSLKGIMLPVAENYRENENRNKNMLSRMAEYAELVNSSLKSAMCVECVPQTETDESVFAQDKAQQLLMGDVSRLQTANIAAITKAVREEYEVKSVELLKTES